MTVGSGRMWEGEVHILVRYLLHYCIKVCTYYSTFKIYIQFKRSITILFMENATGTLA